MQFSAVENRFIVKLKLNSALINDLKRKYFFSKKVHSYRLSHFKRPLKIDKSKILMTNGSFIKVESIAECSSWSIRHYF